MKSKRITKLLACTLVVAMSATPVFASSVTYSDKASGTIDTDFGLYQPVLSVNVDTQAGVKINPLYDVTNGQGVKKYSLASKNISINNATQDDDKKGVPVLVTAKATIKNTDPSVKAYYDYGANSGSKFVKNDNSTAKELYMELQKGSGTSGGLGNYVAVPATSDAAVITKSGSRLQMVVPAMSGGTAGYGEFAVIGEANTGAAWSNTDLSLELTYEIAAVGASTTGLQAINISSLTATSGNAVSINALTDVALAGAAVKDVIVYDQKCEMPESAIATDSISYERNTSDDGWILFISKDDPVVQWLNTAERKNKAIGLLVVLSDGRVSKTDLTVN